MSYNSSRRYRNDYTPASLQLVIELFKMLFAALLFVTYFLPCRIFRCIKRKFST